VKIRKFRKEDEKKVDKLVKNVLFEIFHSRPKRLEDLINVKLFLVAEDKKKIVATIALVKKGKDYIVKRLYINKKYRNKGLGQEMYNRIEEFARKTKISKLKLTTTPQMKAAIYFYKKNGFKKTGEDKKINKIFFEKRLK